MNNQRIKYSILPCLLAGLGFLYVFMQLDLIAPLNHIIALTYHLSFTEIGFFSASYLLGIAIFYILAGILIDHFGPYKWIVIGLGMSVLMTLVFANAHTLAVLVLSRFLGGVSHTIVFLSCIRITSYYYKQHTAVYIGFIISIGLLGGIISQYPFVKLISIINWHDAINIIAGFGAILLIFEFIYFYRQTQPSACSIARFEIRFLLQAIKNPQNFLFGLYACLMNFPVMTIGTSWGNRLLTTHFHTTNLSASEIIPWTYVGFIIGSPLSGWLSDYFHNRKKIMILSAVLLFILTFFWGNPTLGFTGLIIVTFFIGLVSAFQVLSYTCIAETNTPRVQSIAISYASLIIMGGNAVLMPLLGWLMSWHKNNIYAALFIIPLLLLVNICLMQLFANESLSSKIKGKSA